MVMAKYWKFQRLLKGMWGPNHLLSELLSQFCSDQLGIFFGLKRGVISDWKEAVLGGGGGGGLFKSSIFLAKHCRLQVISSNNNALMFVLIHGKSTRIPSFADWDCEEVKCNLCPDHPISFPRCEYCLNCLILFSR